LTNLFPPEWANRNRDARILKAQLDLAAVSVRATLVTSPLWALLIALLCSSSWGLRGHVPLSHSLWLPLAVTLALSFSAWLTARYLSSTRGAASLACLRQWYVRLVTMHLGISAAWGLMPWLLWEPHNPVNHLFLAMATIGVICGMVVARGSNMLMFVACLVPISLMTTLRFMLGDGWDYPIALSAPLFSLQMWHTGRPLVTRMQEDARLRFQIEDMARQLEEARDEALKKRYEAETANASKTAFLANMSHELRTPLNAILGFSEIIAEECFGPVGNLRYKDYAGDIHSSGAHLLSLINDLLDIAKIEAGRMEISACPLDAEQTFDIALKLVAARAAEKHQNLVIRVDANAPPLYADERALKQMLINLVSNAVKFTPEGGRIEVTAGAARSGGFQITVKDNGPGIPREKMNDIFKPFAQADNRYDRQAGGTGLGLALVRGLAELHGGRAWLESEPGQGCTAFIVLPSRAPDRAVA